MAGYRSPVHQSPPRGLYRPLGTQSPRPQSLRLGPQLFELVKAEAEDVILAAGARFGEEIGKVPKGRGPGRAKIAITAQGKF
jgi:hypothetical protein